MARYVALVGVICSLAVMVGSAIMLVSNTFVPGAPVDLQRIYLWSVVFILGVFVTAYGYARMVLP